MLKTSSSQLTVLARVRCPHCWHEYAPEESLWVAEHPDLVGDIRLGADQSVRFLPSRFTAEGDALDAKGYRTTRLACPNCHLEVPRPLYQIPPVYFSILGAPASGKSYFLASMTWNLRQTLPNRFSLSINDTDASANARLHEYEELQFLNPNPDHLVSIAKTQVQGDLYDTINMGDHTVTLPRPFLFTVQPLAKHPNYSNAKAVSRIICMYDNAGESFLPGQDTVSSPVTRHLAKSRCLFFLFDPTQDPRFRRACHGKTDDPQMQPRSERLSRETTVRQDTILLEAINRVRRHAGLRDDELHQRPLVIVVTKWDAWKSLLPDIDSTMPFTSFQKDGHTMTCLDLGKINQVSRSVGELMHRLTPEIVAAGEGFSHELVFIPVSATGRAPEVDPSTGTFGVRPKNISPYWVEVPILYALQRWSPGLIAGKSQNPAKKSSSNSPPNSFSERRHQ